jgi:isopentenyl-diphosphate delta-isomerase
MEDELLDLVNQNDEIIGTVWKSEAHKNPKLIHREIAIAIFNNNGKVLLQQRSMNKSHPGSWKITAAGHIKSGEDPIVAAKRELAEELGLDVNLTYLKKVHESTPTESKFYWVYYALVDGEPKTTLDYSEVMDSAWVGMDELESFSKSHDYDMKGLSQALITEIYIEKVKNIS